MAGLVECRTGSEVIENFKAVRARLRGLKPPAPPPAPEPIPEPPPVIHKIEITETPQETIVMVHVQEAEPGRIHKHPSVDRIVRAVCEKYNVKRDDVLSHRRSYYVCRSRQIAMYLARMLTLRSLPAIGRHLGGRDHTTVLHGVQKITRLRAAGKDNLDQELAELEAILGAA